MLLFKMVTGLDLVEWQLAVAAERSDVAEKAEIDESVAPPLGEKTLVIGSQISPSMRSRGSCRALSGPARSPSA